MGEGSTGSGYRWRAATARSWWWLAASACSLSFDVGDRAFACPPEMTECELCNSDGSCRVPMQGIGMAGPDPSVGRDSGVSQSPLDASVRPEGPPIGPGGPLEPSRPDGSAQPPPDAGTGAPPPSDVCRAYTSRTSDSLCLDGDQQCFSLGSVLSPALVAWLDPTTLPSDGSSYWCDRSGQQHHALLQPDGSAAVTEDDGRPVSAPLARSMLLDGTWLSLSEGKEPVLAAGNFAVVLAAAGLPDAVSPGGELPAAEQPDAAPPAPSQPFELFESGEQSRINLTLVTGSGRLEGKITSQETVLVPTPVITQSSVYDGAFHLYSLHRRSEVRVLDDVLQLRLNGALEARASSIAIPRALNLSSALPPRLGARSTSAGLSSTGRGRIAAAVMFRGAVPEDELARLETFLCTSLAVCGAPVRTIPVLVPGVPPR